MQLKPSETTYKVFFFPLEGPTTLDTLTKEPLNFTFHIDSVLQDFFYF